MRFWEDAVKGSSALQAGLMRRLLDETTVALGMATATVFWDIEKFYDSVDWTKLVHWALELSFSPSILQVAMSIHEQPRVIRVD